METLVKAGQGRGAQTGKWKGLFPRNKYVNWKYTSIRERPEGKLDAIRKNGSERVRGDKSDY